MKEVFISYSTKDNTPAENLRGILEQNGLSCWMAPRDIPGGSNYTKEIPVAIRNCKVFVLVLSDRSQNSQWVLREVDAAVNAGKIILPFMLEDFALNDEFNFLLTGAQRYFAYQQKAEAVQALVDRVRAIVQLDDMCSGTREPEAAEPVAAEPEKPRPVVEAVLNRAMPEHCPTCGSENIVAQPKKFKLEGLKEYLSLIFCVLGMSLLGGLVLAIVAGFLPVDFGVIGLALLAGWVLGGCLGRYLGIRKLHLRRLRHGKNIYCYRCNHCKIVFNHTVDTKQSA